MEGGGAHLGSSLPVSVFHRRRSFSCTGSRLRLRALFSFAGAVFVRGRRFRSWASFSFAGGSPWFMGGRLRSCSWAFPFVRGRASSSEGGRLHSWAFVFVGGRPPSFVGGHAICVWCRGGRSCSFVGGRHCGRSCRWWGTVVGSWWGVVVGNWWGVVVGNWWGVVASRWCVVVVGPRGRLWWYSRVVASLLWLRRGSIWCV